MVPYKQLSDGVTHHESKQEVFVPVVPIDSLYVVHILLLIFQLKNVMWRMIEF